MYLISMGWSDHADRAGFGLEIKLSLIIFPVIFSFMTFSKVELKWIFMSFIFGLLFAIPVDFYRAYQLYLDSGSYNEFFYDSLSKPIHPGYLSMYLNFGCIILINDYFKQELKFFSKTWIYFLVYAILFLFNILVFSKIGLFISFIILIIFLWQYFRKTKSIVLPLSAVVIGVLGFLFVYNGSEYARNTLSEMVENTSYSSENAEVKAQGSTSLRRVVWSASFELIKEKPLIGYGLGDTQEALTKVYERMNEPFALTKKLNSHNQYLETTLALGLVGLSLLMGCLLAALKFAWKEKHWILIGLVLMVMTNFLIESVLEVQAGTIFFGVFYSLLHVKLAEKNA